MNALVQDRYARPAVMIAGGWIAVLSAIVLIDHGHWRHLASQAQSDMPGREIRTLEARVGTLESQLAAQKHQPAPISADRFAERSRALDERLTRLEQGASHGASQQELDTLATRVSALEVAHARSMQTHGSAPVQSKPSLAAANTSAEPPFRLLGFEMRGGETFLAIAPPKAVSLAEMSVLRVGDIEDGWQLETLDGKSATFRFQGQPHRFEVK
jgi:hypothetical protein